MNVKSLQITSASSLDFEAAIATPICFFRGRYSALALDLIRELLGDPCGESDPDGVDDGRFLLHGEVEAEGKRYDLCYIRNADFMGDMRLAANFQPHSLAFSEDDTEEYVALCRNRAVDSSNVLRRNASVEASPDDRPIFIYDYFDRLDEAADLTALLTELGALGRQVFAAVCPRFSIDHPLAQVVDVDSIYGEILCPVCGEKTMDQHSICRCCGWEYDGFPEDHHSAANGTTLRRYREEFWKSRNAERKERNYV